MTKKVVIYARVSTLDQTVDNQLIELRDHCSKMGWEIVKEYADEGLSGTLSREKRLSLNSLIKDAHLTPSSRMHIGNGSIWSSVGTSHGSEGR